MPTGLKILLFIFLPVFLILVVVAAVLGIGLLRGQSIEFAEEVPVGESVAVTISNASLSFGPGSGDVVRITVSGTYAGPEPRFSVDTVDGVTSITGGCDDFWSVTCRLQVDVALPADTPLEVTGTNGAVSITGLGGTVSVTTINGAIVASDTTGALALHTTNGSVDVEASRSQQVSAITTNGRVMLELLEPPTSVIAESTNGAVTVRVPVQDLDYDVTAETVNGSVSQSVPVNSSSDRSISARTVNGSVTIEALQ